MFTRHFPTSAAFTAFVMRKTDLHASWTFPSPQAGAGCVRAVQHSRAQLYLYWCSVPVVLFYMFPNPTLLLSLSPPQRHRKGFKKLNLPADQRKALLRGLTTQVTFLQYSQLSLVGWVFVPLHLVFFFCEPQTPEFVVIWWQVALDAKIVFAPFSSLYRTIIPVLNMVRPSTALAFLYIFRRVPLDGAWKRVLRECEAPKPPLGFRFWFSAS